MGGMGNRAKRMESVWCLLPLFGRPTPFESARKLDAESDRHYFLACASRLPQHRGGQFRSQMKAKIIITPKKAVLDPQGKSVQNALAHLGYQGVGAVHVGKYLEIELAGADREAARKQIDEACHRFLSNPVIEDYRLEIE
jgi:phosphoribosylformylglycinamidine synthase PurS subunit